MAFRTFADSNEAAEYAASLDERWPDRDEIRSHLSRQLAACAPRPPAGQSLNVVELCAGAGSLAEQILADHPYTLYTGIDVSGPLLNVAQSHLSRYSERAEWMEANLNDEEWIESLPAPVHAFVSLQSLHDLGDADAVARIMRLAARALVPGGCLIYADLLADPVANENPGRLTAARHLDLLHESGFAQAANTLLLGPFGCFVAQKST